MSCTGWQHPREQGVHRWPAGNPATVAALHLAGQELHQSITACLHHLALHCSLAATVLCCFTAECPAVACHICLRGLQVAGQQSNGLVPPPTAGMLACGLLNCSVCSLRATPASGCAGGSWHCRWVCHPCGPPAWEGASASGAAVRSCAGPGLGEPAAVVPAQVAQPVSLSPQGEALQHAD